MTPEQILNIACLDEVEVRRRAPYATTSGWYRGIVTKVSRERPPLARDMSTTICVRVEDLKETFKFSGPQINMDVRVPPNEVATLRAQLECARKDADAFKHLADERLAEKKKLQDDAALVQRANAALQKEVKQLCQDRDLATKARDRLSQQHTDFIRGVLKGLDLEGGEYGIDEIALLHRIKQTKEDLDAVKKEDERLAAELVKANATAQKAHNILSDAKIEHDREGDGSFLTRMQWLVEERDTLKTERDAYRKAKQENDERFMNERDAARTEASTERKKRDELQADNTRLRGEVDYWCQAHKKLANALKGTMRIVGWQWSMTEHPLKCVTLHLTPTSILRQLDGTQVSVELAVDSELHRFATEFAPRVEVTPQQDPEALEAREARNILAAALDKLDGKHSTSLVDCAKRAVEYLRAIARPAEDANTKTALIDIMIGRLDRILSEFLIASYAPVDEADRQTLKHHADDLIGVGKAALKRLGVTPEKDGAK